MDVGMIGGSEGHEESGAAANTVETVCVVDIRDNNPESTSVPYELDRIEDTVEGKNGAGGAFHPLQLLDKSGTPSSPLSHVLL
jgi:hypothetical protein